MFKKIIFFILIAILISFCLISCQNKETSNNSNDIKLTDLSKEEELYMRAFTYYALNNDDTGGILKCV